MYVCVYVCMCICVYVCVGVCVYVCLYVYGFACTCVCVFVSLFVCLCMCMFVCVHPRCWLLYIYSQRSLPPPPPNTSLLGQYLPPPPRSFISSPSLDAPPSLSLPLDTYASCATVGFIQLLLSLESVSTLGAIALDRYLNICHPMTYQSTVTSFKMAAVIAYTWALSIVFACIPAATATFAR